MSRTSICYQETLQLAIEPLKTVWRCVQEAKLSTLQSEIDGWKDWNRFTGVQRLSNVQMFKPPKIYSGCKHPSDGFCRNTEHNPEVHMQLHGRLQLLKKTQLQSCYKSRFQIIAFHVYFGFWIMSRGRPLPICIYVSSALAWVGQWWDATFKNQRGSYLSVSKVLRQGSGSILCVHKTTSCSAIHC